MIKNPNIHISLEFDSLPMSYIFFAQEIEFGTAAVDILKRWYLECSDLMGKFVAFKNGRYIDPREFSIRDGNIARISKIFLANLYQAGATIELVRLQMHIPFFKRVAMAVDNAFHCNKEVTNINAYIAPKYSVGAPKHTDPHDVLVIQLAGSKKWNLTLKPDTRPNKLFTYQGDSIYLESCVEHSASTVDDFSIHLTFQFSDDRSKSGTEKMSVMHFLVNFLTTLISNESKRSDHSYFESLSILKYSTAPQIFSRASTFFIPEGLSPNDQNLFYESMQELFQMQSTQPIIRKEIEERVGHEAANLVLAQASKCGIIRCVLE